MTWKERDDTHIEWTPDADRDRDELAKFIANNPWGKPAARIHSINAAIESLITFPEMHRQFQVKSGNIYRALLVDVRFYVAYVYIPPATDRSYGIISVRAIRHAVMRYPLRAVRETPHNPYLANCVEPLPNRIDVKWLE